jgi:restriction system protein
MSRYWVIAPFESKAADVFNRVWQFDLENNVISIGWKELARDVSKLSREELLDAVKSTYPDRPMATKALYANMIWTFYHSIKPGDVVLARRGRKALVAVGEVAQAAFYAPGKSPVSGHPNFIGVSWREQPRDKLFPTVIFPMRTVAEISGEEYRNLSPEARHAALERPADEHQDRTEFALEKYLEEFIVSNFQAIFKGQLRIFEDTDSNDGQQYQTEIGPIDILAVEPKSNSFVVIELKKGRSSDQVVGQVLRYMGWVKRNLCTGTQTVKGLIICRDPDPKLSYALEMAGGIDVRYYSVAFKLAETPEAASVG